MNDIIVFESAPFYFPELKRQLRHQDWRVRLCQVVRRLPELLVESTPAVAVLHLASSPQGCLQFLSAHFDNRRNSPPLAIVSEKTVELEWTLRELGVASVVSEFVRGEALATQCQRLASRGR